jgi:hypothetical protein
VLELKLRQKLAWVVAARVYKLMGGLGLGPTPVGAALFLTLQPLINITSTKTDKAITPKRKILFRAGHLLCQSKHKFQLCAKR